MKRIRLMLGLAALMSASAPGAAWAAVADMSQRVAIGAFRGPQGARLKDAVESALLRRYQLVPDSMVLAAARKSGVPMQSDQDFAQVGKTLNVHAFVTATVHRDRSWRVDMRVRKGETGQTIGRYGWSDRRIEGLTAAVARGTPKRLRGLLAAKDATEPPAVIEKEDEAPAPDEAPMAPANVDQPRAYAARPFLELGVGTRVFNRSMTFVDNVRALPAYRLSQGAAVTAEVAFHPYALFSGAANTWAAGLGLTGSVTYAVGVETAREGSAAAAPTQVYGWEVGLRQRITLGRFDVVPRVSYMTESFTVSGGDFLTNVRYRVARGGAGVRLALSERFALRASGDYLHVVSAGALTDITFPRATAHGVDASLGAAYAFGKGVEAQASVGLRRYAFDMKSQPGDGVIAGGAVDQYLSLMMGLAYRPALGRN